MIYNATLTDHENVCNSCTIYIVFLVICLIRNVSISSFFLFILTGT